MSNPNPRRSTQGSPLTSAQHDDVHTNDRNDIDSLITAVNALVAGSGIPTGTTLEFCGTVLPTGFLWENGAAVSRSTYSTLFAVTGTTFGVGDGSTTFNLPKRQGRVAVGSNPLGGVTDGTLTTRTLGTYFGAETASNTQTPTITLSAWTPAGSVSVTQASIGSITATLGAISLGSVTATMANSAIVISASGGGTTISSGPITPTLTYATCVQLTEGVNVKTFPPCDITVNSFTVDLNKTDIASAVTASITDPSIAIGGSIASPAIAVGGSIPVQSATFTGTASTQTASSSAVTVTVSTMQPAVVKNFIIKT